MRTTDRASLAAIRDAARAALSRGAGGRWELPGGGLLELESPVPFLVVGREDEHGALRRLTGGMASRLIAPADRKLDSGVRAVARAVVEALPADREVWIIGVRLEDIDEPSCAARLTIPSSDRCEAIARAVPSTLRSLEVDGEPWRVRLCRERARCAGELLDGGDCELSIESIDVVVAPVFRGPGGRVYPLVLDDVRRALLQTVSALVDAAMEPTAADRPRPRLGVARLDDAARRADTLLCDAANAFDVLVQLTPANLTRVWQRLVETDFTEEPRLRYRPLHQDPVVLKRRVFAAPVDEVDDPFVAELLRDKQEELDRTLSMLRDRGETFLHESEQLFGRPDESLRDLAVDILAIEHPEEEDGRDDAAELDTAAIVERAREHLLGYRKQDPLFPDELEVRDDIAAGLMVSRGRLLVRAGLTASESRLAALLEHEVGTHVTTWFNGSSQPLALLGTGLAGYEALQEGLAVLAEHLAGGLDPGRMRVLAARVIAADAVVDGASFLEVFHRLRGAHGIGRRAAFQITVRAQRGGGLTKDLAYLRGLLDVVEHVRTGEDLEPLYVGKIALKHLPVVRMLLDRGAIVPPRVLPRVLADPEARKRLARLRRSESAVNAIVRMAGGRQ